MGKKNKKDKKDKKHKCNCGGLFRHPFFITILGFILGELLTMYIERSMNSIQTTSREIENRKNAVTKLSTYILERKERITLLLSAFKRNAELQEIKQRKYNYDEVFVKWNTHRNENLFLIKEILDDESYKDFEDILNEVLVREIFYPLDICITKAYDARLQEEHPSIGNNKVSNTNPSTFKESNGKPIGSKKSCNKKSIDSKCILAVCHANKLRDRASKCGEAITVELYELSRLARNINDNQKFNSYKEILKKCK